MTPNSLSLKSLTEALGNRIALAVSSSAHAPCRPSSRRKGCRHIGRAVTRLYALFNRLHLKLVGLSLFAHVECGHSRFVCLKAV